MHLSKVNEALDHKITGGSEFCWTCWPEARYLDYESEYAHASVVFNTQTQEVYVAEINDKLDNLKPYRWMNPLHKQAYFDEAKEREVDPNIAWDNKKWYDLETREDWLTKSRAIIRGEEFDARIEVPLEIDDDTLFELFIMAHKRDVTLNEMVEIVLEQAIANMSTEK